MKQIDLREGARRQHRAISLFAVIQCWSRNLDGVGFERAHLERLLGLKRFKRTRVEWLEEDLKEFFPFTSTYWITNASDSLHSMLISRLSLSPFLPNGSMTTSERIAGIAKGGPKIGMFKIWERPKSTDATKLFETFVPFFADSANYDERFLSAYLSLLSQGQISPKSLPALKNPAPII